MAQPDFCPKVFLLSPANANGPRAQMLLNPGASFELAFRFRQGSAQLGELFTFISGLYFRGKLTYAGRFGASPAELPPSLVITPGRGLLAPDTVVSPSEFLEISAVSIDLRESRYRETMERAALDLCARTPESCPVVLLGSVATPKYVEPLLNAFGQRLLFPEDFVGRGDMSRGGLLLRSANTGEELRYIPVLGAVRHGPRPPRLPKLLPQKQRSD